MFDLECDCEFEIERLRKQLIKVAEEEGLHADKTIILSRKLDIMINKFDQQEIDNDS
ncbi:aspartyl-phosphate phosphatase Spo0E family protein [Sporosarcina sp. PTS2304]|uniref:aspartyl-phosphate phosphatase Spo0E family protein n=1 Tax=Sporosarcina sp. PTS2304 TaxID=2283194 RepID=UPI000E0D0094|nr:aspartyl-phosphate phosphatase Spo0E family protein [Sporosarcina sp. PTS2304]